MNPKEQAERNAAMAEEPVNRKAAVMEKQANRNAATAEKQAERNAAIVEITGLLFDMNEDQLRNMRTYAVDESREPNHEAEALEAVVRLSRKYGKRKDPGGAEA